MIDVISFDSVPLRGTSLRMTFFRHSERSRTRNDNMKQSQLFSKTSKTKAGQSGSTNHDLLVRGGFIDQLAAGIYSYLPLGAAVLANISKIVREEMNAVGGQEVL